MGFWLPFWGWWRISDYFSCFAMIFMYHELTVIDLNTIVSFGSQTSHRPSQSNLKWEYSIIWGSIQAQSTLKLFPSLIKLDKGNLMNLRLRPKVHQLGEATKSLRLDFPNPICSNSPLHLRPRLRWRRHNQPLTHLQDLLYNPLHHSYLLSRCLLKFQP